ncbi:hypothetical protein AWC38_SpisGene24017 [Stylophora pistillata]|uniref:Apple domain-containing protein n=1 Tax=Stylophora pistillata TaxID=50429 RepID=A0A2B4R5I6_STYPI|nr:hypothetical protein AWC38_SpisGene24017 [Stylophora pistillata]
MFCDIASQQCGACGDLHSIYQMMLQGHTYETFKFTPGTLECREACLADDRCQSYNVVMFIGICKLNNLTKEARPEDFVKDKDRYYMAIGPKRGVSRKLRSKQHREAFTQNRLQGQIRSVLSCNTPSMAMFEG